MSYPYDKRDKKAYIENKVIELINTGRSKSDAEWIAEEWWEEVSNEDDYENSIEQQE